MDSFRKIYELSAYSVKAAISRLKSGQVSNDPNFSDKTKVAMSMKEIRKTSKKCTTKVFISICSPIQN